MIETMAPSVRSLLAHPLISRLPVIQEESFRSGHTRHEIPKGYLESLSTGKNQIEDPTIARLYDSIKRITRGELTDSRRLREILAKLIP